LPQNFISSINKGYESGSMKFRESKGSYGSGSGKLLSYRGPGSWISEVTTKNKKKIFLTL
jgi:hypothetical protein